MKHIRTFVLLALGAAALASASAAGAAPNASSYRVTITNLTLGQPLTPPVVATHRRPVHVFRVGAPASFGVKEIAENGNNGPLLSALGGANHVSSVVQAGAGPLVPPGTPQFATLGNSVTFTIGATRGAKYLSFVSMLVCTNDGFTGVDGLRLPKKVGSSVSVATNAYDAGTERNTEDFAVMVPPCQALIGISSGEPGQTTSNPALAEHGVIHGHAGIVGGADLVPGVGLGHHGWTDPVAQITITAIA
jgi:Spondin_N